ncbi:hypothetical protein J5X84_21955 [Streptosporangiaceae bacterium NEAU-GS5]|nr:hypothetical protein [Streptosporangiaceae bacterium NEAU-GS5]
MHSHGSHQNKQPNDQQSQRPTQTPGQDQSQQDLPQAPLQKVKRPKQLAGMPVQQIPVAQPSMMTLPPLMLLEPEIVLRPDQDAPTTFELTGTGVTATIDYSAGIELAERKGMAFCLSSLCQNLGFDGAEICQTFVESAPKERQDWLMRALTIYAGNLGLIKGLNMKTFEVFLRLHIMATKSQPVAPMMPGITASGFEQQVIFLGGWMPAQLCALPSPAKPVLKRIRLYYFPGGVPDPQTGRRVSRIEELNAELLHTGMTKALKDVVDDQLFGWTPPENEELEAVDFAEIATMAAFVEEYVKKALHPYPLAYIEGPCYKGSYASDILSTADGQIDDDMMTNWMVNRGTHVGRMAKWGQPLSAASYDPGRSSDRDELTRVYHALLSDQGFTEKLRRLIALTPRHNPGNGKVYIEPVYPNRLHIRKAVWRWRITNTLIHEFMHRITHPKVITAAEQTHQPQILKEGFVEVFTVKVMKKLVADAATDPVMRDLLLGIGTTWELPHTSSLEVGYGAEGKDAESIDQEVGEANSSTAFFLGEVRLIGL